MWVPHMQMNDGPLVEDDQLTENMVRLCDDQGCTFVHCIMSVGLQPVCLSMRLTGDSATMGYLP